MIHTVHIDDSTENGKRLLEEIRKNNEGIELEASHASSLCEPVEEYVKTPTKPGHSFENPPEGYMTAEEFRKKSRQDIDQLCKKHGLL